MPKILLIEDDAVMVNLLKTLLKIEGFDVVAYLGDGDVFKAIKQERPDVIILDVNLKNIGMDDLTGFDLLKFLRSDDVLSNTGVIMSSGMNYQMESKKAGADGFIMKPYMPEDLLEIIRKIVTKN
jgi:DNA-binding response OmpR family regulator